MPEICPKCGDLGLTVIRRVDGTQFAEPCTCRIERRAERMLKNARIPRRYQGNSFESFETMHNSATKSVKNALRTSYKFAEAYPLHTAGKGLLFVGPKGVGKTHLAVGILKEVIIKRGATGIFWEHKELLENLRSTYDVRSAGSETGILKAAITCDLLVLDDLGEVSPSEWTWDTTSYILNSRYNEEKSTIITSNLPNQPASINFSYEIDNFVPDPSKEARRAMTKLTLADRIGDRIWSRLQEMCVPVEVEGEDFRQKVKRASFA